MISPVITLQMDKYDSAVYCILMKSGVPQNKIMCTILENARIPTPSEKLANDAAIKTSYSTRQVKSFIKKLKNNNFLRATFSETDKRESRLCLSNDTVKSFFNMRDQFLSSIIEQKGILSNIQRRELITFVTSYSLQLTSGKLCKIQDKDKSAIDEYEIMKEATLAFVYAIHEKYPQFFETMESDFKYTKNCILDFLANSSFAFKS